MQDEEQQQQKRTFVEIEKLNDEFSISHPRRERWQFGLEISATADVRGISASVPVPSEWPEQKLIESETIQSDNISRVKISEPGPGARQLEFRIDRMAAGDTARIVYDVVVEKSLVVGPANTDGYRIPQKPPTEIRKFLQPSPYIESRDRRIMRLAKSLEIDDALPAWDQVEQIYQWVRENVEYEFDTKIHTCMHALETGKGDCEELSSLFIAICRVRGIPARAVWIPDHTYPEFYLEDADGTGHWIPCQAAGSYSFGDMIDYSPILQKGDKFKVAGHRAPLRYVQPTLIARDAAGAPTMKWIMTRVEDDATKDDEN